MESLLPGSSPDPLRMHFAVSCVPTVQTQCCLNASIILGLLRRRTLTNVLAVSPYHLCCFERVTTLLCTDLWMRILFQSSTCLPENRAWLWTLCLMLHGHFSVLPNPVWTCQELSSCTTGGLIVYNWSFEQNNMVEVRHLAN